MEPPKNVHPFTARLLAENAVFREFPVPANGPELRQQLPHLHEPSTRSKIWSILKENVGKELSKIAVPVSFNEPISMLQRCAENVEYHDLIRKANQTQQSELRLGYVMASMYILNSNTINRISKPFNPLLGETYEYIEKDLRIVVEQVSHHPPICAFHAECDDFVLQGNFLLKSKLSLTSFKILPMGATIIKLKSTGETFSLTKPKAKLHNYIVGAPYLWFSGSMSCLNQLTGEKGVINFKPKGWTSKDDYVCDGVIYDKKGAAVYELNGMWNSHLTAVHVNSKQEVSLAKRKKEPNNVALQNYFTQFLINVNHLSQRMLAALPPTDSRLRPDQRAHEFGDMELASREKTRLEENQRARKKKGVQEGYKPMWFDFTMDGNDINTRFRGEYWKCRDAGKWPDQIADLYNEPPKQ